MTDNHTALKTLSLKRFLHHFCADKREGQKFCFILGSGASFASNIPTGAQLVKKWMAEMKAIYDPGELAAWIKADELDKNDLAKDYGKIFTKRFELDEKKGFAELEAMMDGAEPSCGYSVLAQILATTDNNIVITTNFDSLTEDALFIYTQKKPLVVGHEALAHYIRVFGNRPVIAKIHRDLYLSPKNDQKGTGTIAATFKANLSNIFAHYTPVVIGYGGNDGSLMGFLEELSAIEGGIYWCYREQSVGPVNGQLNQRICKLIIKSSGWAVPIPGFDELLLQMGNQLGFDARFDDSLIKVAERRAADYRQQIETIEANSKTATDTKTAVSSMVAKGGKDWWYYEQRVRAESDKDKKELIYREGIAALGDNRKSASLIGRYASFLTKIRKDYECAEQYYQQALELEPNNPYLNNNYALFLMKIRKDYEQAEQYYQQALELEPDDAIVNGNYAVFLSDIRKDHEQAEQYYYQAREIAPDNMYVNGNYAKHLMLSGQSSTAVAFINKALALNDGQENELALELWFYRYAGFFNDYPTAKAEIEGLLAQGIGSPGSLLDDIVALAQSLNHPQYDQVAALAQQITQIPQ